MPTGSIAYFSDEQENVLRVSPAGRIYYSESFSKVKNHSPINVTAASGGSVFESVPVGQVIVYSESGNGIMWVGGTNTSGEGDCPYSGHGFPLFGGEQTPFLPVTNFDAVRVCASISGQIVYALGFLNGVDTILTNTVAEPPPVIISGEVVLPVGIGYPYVIAHSPTSGFSGVALGSEITVTFNEEILQGSVTSGSFALSPAANVTLYRDVTYENIVRMVPNGVNLSGSTTYIAGINNQITDFSGNPVSGTSGGSWVFTFPFTTQLEPDVTGPEVSGTNPADGATNISAGANVVVTFSEPMASGTVTPSNLYLSYTQGAIPASGIPAVVTLASDLYTATINPIPNLIGSNTEVFINVLSGVTDLYDNSMTANDDNRSYTTATYDVVPPTVSSTVPASGTSGVSIDTDVIVVFSEEMLSGTINVTNLFVSDISGVIPASGIPATVTLSGNGLAAKIDPSYSLSGGGTYHINVMSGVTDLIGNNMVAHDRSRTFTILGGGYTEVYNVTDDSNLISIDGGLGSNTRAGEKFSTGATMIGQTPKKFTLRLAKLGTPTGSALLRIRDSGNSIVSEVGSINVATLTGSKADYTITNDSQSHTIADGDRIILEYTGGNAANTVYVYYNSSPASYANGIFTYYMSFSASWNDSTGGDVGWIIYIGGGGEADTTAPTVSGTVPLSGVSGISRDSNVVITFSEGMLPGSINAQDIYLSYLSGVVPTSGISGVVTLSGNLLAAEINPTNNLSGNSLIHINILSGVRDYAGNNLTAHDRSRTFSTELVDNTGPTVSGTIPVSGTSGVALSSNVVITFSEQVFSGTIHGYNIYLSDIYQAVAASGIPATVTLSGNNIAVEVDPTSNLSGDKTYYINVLADVQDLAGNNMIAHDRSRTFKTVDTIPPTVQSTSPVSGASGIAVGSDVMVIFSEAMLSGTINTSTVFISDISGAISASGIPATVTLSGNNIATRIDPTSNLSGATTYYINVLSGVTDLVGNNMTAHDRQRTFTTNVAGYTEIYNETTGTNAVSIYSAGSRAGLVINSASSTLIGQTPKKFTIKMSKTGSPTGTATLRIRDSGDNIVSDNIGTIDVSTIPTSPTTTNYDFENALQGHALANGDRILVEYSGGNSSNYIRIYRTSTDVVSYVCECRYTTVYTDNTTYDWTAIIYV